MAGKMGAYHILQERQAAWQHLRCNAPCTTPAICGTLVLEKVQPQHMTPDSQHHIAYRDEHSLKGPHKGNKLSFGHSVLLALMHHRQVGKDGFPSILPHACTCLQQLSMTCLWSGIRMISAPTQHCLQNSSTDHDQGFFEVPAGPTVTSILRRGSTCAPSSLSSTVYSQPSRVTTRRNSVRKISPGRDMKSSVGVNFMKSSEVR